MPLERTGKPPHRVREESGTCVGGGRRKGPFLSLSGGTASETTISTRNQLQPLL